MKLCLFLIINCTPLKISFSQIDDVDDGDGKLSEKQTYNKNSHRHWHVQIKTKEITFKSHDKQRMVNITLK